MSIAENIDQVKERLSAVCKLIAVTKTHPVEVLRKAYDAGHKIFGENKVQEMEEKYDRLPKDIEWHMIGHLQTNKVKYISPFVKLIHSIDSLKLLKEVDKQAQKAGRVIECLFQIHIAQEETKFGFSPEELKELMSSDSLHDLRNVKIVGLMGMASNTSDVDQIRGEFKLLKALFEECKKVNKENMEMKELSMGMSSDYEIAIEEGSTLVRVGSAIFGNRNYKV